MSGEQSRLTKGEKGGTTVRDDPLNSLKARRGEECNAVLTEDDVRQILVLLALRDQYKAQWKALSNAHLAEKFGVHVRTIEKVISGETWSHVRT